MSMTSDLPQITDFWDLSIRSREDENCTSTFLAGRSCLDRCVGEPWWLELAKSPWLDRADNSLLMVRLASRISIQ
jgi:hypothetical protein